MTTESVIGTEAEGTGKEKKKPREPRLMKKNILEETVGTVNTQMLFVCFMALWPLLLYATADNAIRETNLKC